MMPCVISTILQAHTVSVDQTSQKLGIIPKPTQIRRSVDTPVSGALRVPLIRRSVDTPVSIGQSGYPL